MHTCAQVWRIEKLRAKRAFEATLPPLDDDAQLPLRQRMIEEWETGEWKEREEEIHGVHDERLDLLEQALLVSLVVSRVCGLMVVRTLQQKFESE
jgi:hypothetical protein